MSIRLSRVASGILVLAAMLLAAEHCLAIRFPLPPSKDEYGLKYDVAITEADGGKLTVVFTLADEGRLKPLYAVDVVAFSKQTDSQGGRSYDVNEKLELKPGADGKRVATATFSKEHLDRAKIRIITLMVDGKRQPSGGAIYDIPLSKYAKEAAAIPASTSR